MRFVRLDNPFLRSYLYLAWSKPSVFPGAFWREAFWIRAGAYLFLGCALICAYLIYASGFNKVFWAVPGIGLAHFVAGPLVVQMRLKRRVLVHDFMVCRECGYSLIGLPARHRCPECATEYDIDALRAYWERWFP